MFDTADTYANGRAETILGDASAAELREGLEVLTKVFGATEPGGPNDSGLSRKHIRTLMLKYGISKAAS